MRAYFYDKKSGEELTSHPLHGKQLLAISGNVRRDGEFVRGTCDSVTVCDYADMNSIKGERVVTAADFPTSVKIKVWSPNPELCEWRDLVVEEGAEIKRVLGHPFRKMTKQDYYGFASAPADALICELEDRVLIWCPTEQELCEVVSSPDCTVEEKVWKATEVRG